MRFGSARFLRMRLMRIDCELYNKKNCVVPVLHMGTFQDHVQRDFLVVSQDAERSTIPFFTLWTVKRTKSLQQKEMVSISNQLFKTRPQFVEQPQHLLSSTLPCLPNQVHLLHPEIQFQQEP